MTANRYRWGVLVPNPASLAAITLNRAIHRTLLEPNELDLKREEHALVKASVPFTSQWAGAIGFEHFNRYIYTNGGLHTERNFSARENAESLALTALVRDKLLPAVLFFQWIDEENYENWTKPYCAELAGIGWGLILPAKVKTAVAAELTAIMSYTGGGVDTINGSIDVERMRNYALKLAKEAIGTLSNRLRKYHESSSNHSKADVVKGFYGVNNLTSVDCLVYSYLAVIRGAPWPNKALQDLLTEHANLCAFIEEMSMHLFPEVPRPSVTSTGVQDDDTTKRRELIKNSINAGLVFMVVGFLVYNSPFATIAKRNLTRIRESCSQFFNWLYPSTERAAIKPLEVTATAETPRLMHEATTFIPKAATPTPFSALG